MGAESWFHSLWRIPRKHDANSEKLVIGVLAFEIASLMSKVVNLWQSLSDKQIARLREETTDSIGLRKLISDDENFIVRLICVEKLENMAHVAESVARLGKKCSDPIWKGFENAFYEFIAMGVDPYGWEFTGKKMEKNIKKMERFISTNATLYQEMEQSLTRLKTNGESSVLDLIEYQKMVAWKTQEVKHLKDISLWNKTYDYTVHLLARSLFTIYRKISQVFGVQEIVDVIYQKRNEIVDVGGIDNSSVLNSDLIHRSKFSALLQSPPPKTLGAAALALHYANVIIVIEKLAASPHLIGLDARKDLYNMLPRRVTAALRGKLKPYTNTMASSLGYDPSQAEEWTQAMSSLLEWLAPLAHHMIRWQSKRSFEQQSFVSRTNVLLVQTLYFANQEKTEQVITELLVGLNYVWRYGMELNAKALAECGSLRVDNGYPNLNG
ncbi:protein PSK SIMULATOR 1-like [Lotus japonicus]|uniref:protein PSK SIMULATOR 1-like n=1 Tax=Lotus japonicus TaxID=34305 RepID=UPI0025862012|nr:protein PSK SIMULATOR 1-like [Lotus japonicus]XP_057451660.1 protein PSK SIMULATOR 1-like [Lotus japonicus]